LLNKDWLTEVLGDVTVEEEEEKRLSNASFLTNFAIWCLLSKDLLKNIPDFSSSLWLGTEEEWLGEKRCGEETSEGGVTDWSVSASMSVRLSRPSV
jgi:hypothetical protein